MDLKYSKERCSEAEAYPYCYCYRYRYRLDLDWNWIWISSLKSQVSSLVKYSQEQYTNAYCLE